LQTAYAGRPDLWFAVAEENRYEVYLDATDQFRALLRDIVDSEFAGEDNMWGAMDLDHEGSRAKVRDWLGRIRAGARTGLYALRAPSLPVFYCRNPAAGVSAQCE
jgi:hypothetical protein